MRLQLLKRFNSFTINDGPFTNKVGSRFSERIIRNSLNGKSVAPPVGLSISSFIAVDNLVDERRSVIVVDVAGVVLHCINEQLHEPKAVSWTRYGHTFIKALKFLAMN